MAMDPYIDDVVLLCHFDGVAGDETCVSEIGQDPNLRADCALDNTRVKFGPTSVDCSAAGEYPIFDNAGDWDFLHNCQEDWTLDIYININSLNSTKYVFDTYSDGGASGIRLSVPTDGTLFLNVSSTGNAFNVFSASGAITADFWHYIRVTFSTTGGFTLYLDGVQVANRVLDTPSLVSSNDLYVGGSRTFSSNAFNGWIDEIRITRGVDRGNDGVPDEEFPDNTILYEGYLAAPFCLTPKIYGSSDVRGMITQGATYYYMDLTGSPPVRIPISSWQATNQTGSSQYLQAVIPACDDYVDILTERQGTDLFTISKASKTLQGFDVVVAIASGPIETLSFSQGGVNYTCVVSGYSDPAAVPDTPETILLTGIRSVSTNAQAKTRVRCTINWSLVPGDTVVAGGNTFTADYINYYATGPEAYMDVGSR